MGWCRNRAGGEKVRVIMSDPEGGEDDDDRIWEGDVKRKVPP